MNMVTSTATVFTREVRSKIRTPWPFVESLVDPLLLLVLFGPLVAGLGGVEGLPSGDTTQWFVPGILVVMTFSTSAFIGSGIQEERQAGALERMLVTPVSRLAMLLGRVLRVVVIVAVQTVVVMAITIPFGLDVFPVGFAVAVAQLAVLAGALGVVSLAAGLALTNAYAFWGMVTIFYTPVIVTSGALLPMDLAPDWLYAVSRINPLAHVVEAQRSLFVGDVADPAVALGFGVAFAFGVAGALIGTRALNRVRV
ncbi:ABC transporter permease [Actinobacteria bacterium YIM 96077]|uniref:Transport permease protein n=1 Tax=Phytoactinopolyspora halophila TaxID=1981511 RepID=A0A329QDC3_9ACTN|nr:ABC transporter permease [Phytoactinopolyspora halophila]AYY13074.1 ABC transporter permease [Actinobacteria bacterium YIM 96077]RAW09232.1 ABC transporter permease [Phytoactinopolyspora halophila]